MKPLLRWAGGKSKLLNTLEDKCTNITLETYIEPFLGGGALFFHLKEKYINLNCILNDLNPQLMNFYLCVKHYVKDLIDKLLEIERAYYLLDDEDRDILYYKLRTIYNTQSLGSLDFAAYFYFLNKNCFNGLYRVNKKNKFNTPKGDYKSVKFANIDLILKASELLNMNTSLFSMNYIEFLKNKVIDNPKLNPHKTLIYLDPPYRKTKPSSFTAYCKSFYNDEDSSNKLLEQFKLLSNLDYKVILSNANTNDNYFQDNYKHFKIYEIDSKTSISGKKEGRGKQSELIICNF